MSTRLQIAGLVFMMVNAVAFGVGIVSVWLIPALANNIRDHSGRRNRELRGQRSTLPVHRAAPARPLLAHPRALMMPRST
jgi:hypothetical protein